MDIKYTGLRLVKEITINAKKFPHNPIINFHLIINTVGKKREKGNLL